MEDKNMKSNEFAENYKTTQILTASPGKLLLMLYQKCIENLENGIDELEKEKTDLSLAHGYIIKAQEIIGELVSTLDMEKGKEFAKNIESLYLYMLRQLVEANMTKTTDKIKEVKTLMEELYASWKVAVEKTSEKGSQSKSSQGNSGFNISG